RRGVEPRPRAHRASVRRIARADPLQACAEELHDPDHHASDVLDPVDRHRRQPPARGLLRHPGHRQGDLRRDHDGRSACAQSRRRPHRRALRPRADRERHPVPRRRPAGIAEMSGTAKEASGSVSDTFFTEDSKEPPRAVVSASLWGKGLAKLRRDRVGMASLAVVLAYFLIACGVWLGLIGQDWYVTSGSSFGPMSAEHWFGTTRNGQDIFDRAIYSTKVAFEIGLLVALVTTAIGGVLGATAGYFAGTWIDEIVLWLMGVLDALPFYLFVAAVAFAMQGHPLGMHVALIATLWPTTGRVVRGEVIKLKSLEFVEAARTIGAPDSLIIFRHILPNTSHILLVQATIVFVTAIKA